MIQRDHNSGQKDTPHTHHSVRDSDLPAPRNRVAGSKTPPPKNEKSIPGQRIDPSSPSLSSNELENPPNLPQLQSSSRVEHNMATLALDPVKTAGHRSLHPEQTHPAPSHATELDSDSAIMLRVRDGDEAAFTFLVEKYHRPMIHYMYRMARNQAVAEELAQEVFLRVYRSRESYRAEARFSTWLYRIATNLGVNHARDTRHERAAHTIYLDEHDSETGTRPDVADSGLTAEQNLVRKERMNAIREHVMALPERQRNAVLMHKYQGLDYRQIGEVLKLSESATKSLLFRAYQTLRVKLKEFVEEN